MRDAGAPSIRMGATAPITPPVTAMGATPQGPTSGIWDITSPGGSTIITASRVNASRRWAIRWAGSSSDTPSLGLREGTEPRELFGNRRYDDERAATLELDPYGYRWVRFEAAPAGALPAI